MKIELRALILILIFAFLVHLSYLNNGFVWLDHGDIEGKRAVLPISQLTEAFVSRFGDTNFYRPLVTVFNSLDTHFYQGNSWGFHLTNVLLHLLVVLAAYFFAGAFFKLNKQESVFVSLVTAVHPLTILPVGAISYRQELLATFFSMMTIVTYIKATATGKQIWLFSVLFFWLASLFSKESSILWVPALILIWEWTQEAEKKKINYQSYFLISAGAVCYFFLRKFAGLSLWTGKGAELSWSEAIGTRLIVLLKRLSELISPLKPSFSDATRIVDLANLTVWLSFFILLAAIAIAIKSGRKSTVMRLVLFICVGLLPSLSLIPLPRFSSPHYGLIVIPAAGVMAVLLFRRINNQFIKKIAILLSGLWLLLMSISTFKAGFQFKNDYTLFSPEVGKDNNFREGHFYLGDYFLRQGDYRSAEHHLEAALKENPEYIAFVDKNAAMTNLAGVYLAQDKYLRAEKVLEELIKNSTGSKKLIALYNLAVIRERRGDYLGIVILLKDTLGQWSDRQPILLYLKALVKSGNLKEAGIILKDRLNIVERLKQEEIIQSILH